MCCKPGQLLTYTTPGIQMTYHLYTSVEQNASKTVSSQAQLQREISNYK